MYYTRLHITSHLVILVFNGFFFIFRINVFKTLSSIHMKAANIVSSYYRIARGQTVLVFVGEHVEKVI